MSGCVCASGEAPLHPTTLVKILPSANEVCEGYIFTPVCQSFCSKGGVCRSACWDTPPPPEPEANIHPGPEADTPPPPDQRQAPRRTRNRTPYPPRPEADTPLWEQTPVYRHPPPPPTRSVAVHAERYGQQAGGTCCLSLCLLRALTFSKKWRMLRPIKLFTKYRVGSVPIIPVKTQQKPQIY